MDLHRDALQALVNGWSAMEQTKRASSQMTLGALIEVLGTLSPERIVEGIGAADSYRGYYADLAFSPHVPFNMEDPMGVPQRTVGDLLDECRKAMGRVFHGYKGGEFQMGERTPLWISTYGSASGQRLMGLDTSVDPIVPIVAFEED